MFKRLFCILIGLLLPLSALASEFYVYGDRSKAKIAITIDDCHDKAIMGKFMDLAKQHNAKLSFFPIGRTLQGDADEALYFRLLEEGHEIGCHSNRHKNMTTWKYSKITEDLQAFQQRLDKVLGFRYHPNFIRFPYGIGTTAPGLPNYNRGAKEAGYERIVYWDVVLDTPEAMLSKIQNGSIVLLHANQTDLKAFEQIVGALTEKFTLVTVSELLDVPAVKYEMY